MRFSVWFFFFFFFNDTATTEIYTFPYTTLFRSSDAIGKLGRKTRESRPTAYVPSIGRSEEHTSELQSRPHLVCRLLLEKKKKKRKFFTHSQKKKKERNVN